MANHYFSSYPDPAVPNAVALDTKGGRLRTTPSLKTFAGAIALADVLFLGRIPSNARFSQLATLYYTALANSGALNIGLRHPRMTSTEQTNAAAVLWSAQSVSAAGSRKLAHALSLANANKRVWEIAGMAADPGGEFDIVAVCSTATTDAGSIFFENMFVVD